jgi:hypothetical protein
MKYSQEDHDTRIARIKAAEKIADELIYQADRDRAKALCDIFDKEGGEYPPTYCLAVATLAAHAMARSNDPKLLRVALLMMIDRQFADAEFIRESEDVAKTTEAELPSQDNAENA